MDPNEFDELTETHTEPMPETSEAEAPAPVVETVESFEEPPVAVEEAPAEPEAPSELELLKSQFEKQQEMLERLLQGKPLIDVPDAPPQQPQQYVPQAPVPAQPEEPLLTEEQFNAILSDPAAFNGFISALVKKTREEAVQEAYGLSLQNIPGVILPAVHEAANTQIKLRQWAESNPIVMQNRQLAATVLDQIDGHYPMLSIEEKFQKTLEYLNSHYGYQAQQFQAPVPGVVAPVQRPAFAQPPRGGRPTPPPKTQLEAELDEL